MKCGFSVSVKEIPLGEGNSKNDPDSYCKDIALFRHLDEVDFIIWYASYIFKSTVTTDEKSDAINRICSMVALIKDDVKETMYLRKLQEFYKDSGLWKASINQAKKLIHAKRVLAESKNIDRDLYTKYGFYEEHNSY